MLPIRRTQSSGTCDCAVKENSRAHGYSSSTTTRISMNYSELKIRGSQPHGSDLTLCRFGNRNFGKAKFPAPSTGPKAPNRHRLRLRFSGFRKSTRSGLKQARVVRKAQRRRLPFPPFPPSSHIFYPSSSCSSCCCACTCGVQVPSLLPSSLLPSSPPPPLPSFPPSLDIKQCLLSTFLN
jgi:hypothetical protein